MFFGILNEFIWRLLNYLYLQKIALTGIEQNQLNMNRLLPTLFFVLMLSPCYAQGKSQAFFMIGDYANPKWEKIEFSFTNKAREITYSYRQNESGVKLKPFGVKYIDGQRGLMVKFPTGNKIYVILQDRKKQRILMKSEDGQYNKAFALGYEGPVNGVGTYCAVCANEPAEAFGIIDSFLAMVSKPKS